MHRLGSVRNANKVLAGLGDYLSSFRDGEAVYYLNKAGRERIGSDKVRTKTLQARHFLMRNELFLALGRPSTWQNEMRIQQNGVTIVCDALFRSGAKYHFVEIDYTQKMAENQRKLERYRKLRLKHAPQLVWVTTTEHRRKRLAQMCEGMDAVIYTIDDLR